MLKASELVAFCLSMVGMPYWYGTCVYNCTSSLRKRKANQYPTHYKSSRNARYNSDISNKLVCMDCVGMIKGFFWTSGGVGVQEAIGTGKTISAKYGGNGCPDKTASGMLTWCKSKKAQNGTIDTLPEVPGVLLFTSGHVGVYVGNGYAVEARGFDYGVVKTQVSARSWKNWAYMPSSVLEYDTANGTSTVAPSEPEKETTQKPAETVKPTESNDEYKLGDRTIKRGIKGDDVAQLQTALVSLQYNLGTYGSNKDGVDGNCGTKTVNAIKEFQEKYGLEVDGKYGKKSHAKMLEVLANIGTSESKQFSLRVTGSTVNVRNKPNTRTGDIMYRVKKDAVIKAIGTDKDTGWYILDDYNYISNEFTVKV